MVVSPNTMPYPAAGRELPRRDISNRQQEIADELPKRPCFSGNYPNLYDPSQDSDEWEEADGEPDYQLTRAILREDKYTCEWEEAGGLIGVTATSTDGRTYEGRLVSKQAEDEAEIKLRRFRGINYGEVLVGNWQRTLDGRGGRVKFA